MLSRIKKYIAEKKLFGFEQKILLAVSGGGDSTAMADMFFKCGFNFAICHVNFQLRGSDADSDELFVKNMAEKYGVKFFSTRFDTKNYALEHKISIEMAARELRYNYFEQVMQHENFCYTAVAHHKDDAAETFFLNLLRGSGIGGLTGIAPKNNKIIRPLLCFSRQEIENYLKNNNLNYCTDKTNGENVYLRNKFRNVIIPQLEQINPNFRNNLAQTLEFLSSARNIYQRYVDDAKTQCFKKIGSEFYVDINKLKQIEQPECVLFEIVKDFGFNRSQIFDMVDSMLSQSGKMFFSKDYKILKDRDYFIISSNEKITLPTQDFVVNIDDVKNGIFEIEGLNLEFSILQNSSDFKILKDKDIVYFDMEKLVFPMVIRNWKNGDFFVPFGNTGVKKLSDFFINIKLSVAQKNSQKLLVSDGKIVWVIGCRADNRFRITDKTNKVLKIRILH